MRASVYQVKMNLPGAEWSKLLPNMLLWIDYLCIPQPGALVAEASKELVDDLDTNGDGIVSMSELAEASVVALTSVEVLALPKRHFDTLLGSERTLHLIRHRYEARYPDEEALVKRYFAAGQWQEYRGELLGEVRRTLPGEPGRGRNASAIFGNPPWVAKTKGRRVPPPS